MRWNDTVANLTLLALGSSAPEILLSCVEMGREGFYAGPFGPSTIVGSAAFNLFIIVGVCILSIPSPEVRIIKQTGVFAVTAVASLLVYSWLVFIVQWSSPNVITIAEASLTLCFFPVLIIVSWLVDVGWISFSRNKEGQEEKAVENEEEEDDAASEPNSEDEKDMAAFANDPNVIKDETMNPIQHPAGILTFEDDAMIVESTLQEQTIVVQIFRRNGSMGEVGCRYRTEKLSAVPGADYEEIDGELVFDDGQTTAEIELTVMPKKQWACSDAFQLILEEADGGAMFNPTDDGGEDCSLLTVTIATNNETHKASLKLQILCMLDRLLNLDEMIVGSKSWAGELKDVILDINGKTWDEASKLDWILYFGLIPWNFSFILFVPPTHFIGGWVTFVACIAHIGFLTSLILDFAELFGCVTGISGGITAILFVALGTSMPDLFVSQTAAVNDEYADASIVNVTGSNAVNVLLGIGLPWTIGAIYWKVVGATPEWKLRYTSFVDDHPNGAFIVEGGDLGFSVVVFTLAAFAALWLIRFRRQRFGGELGGPWKPKLASSMFLFSLWVIYIMLSVWKMAYNLNDVGPQLAALCTIENIVFAFGVFVNIAYVCTSLGDLADKLGSS